VPGINVFRIAGKESVSGVGCHRPTGASVSDEELSAWARRTVELAHDRHGPMSVSPRHLG
jgi:hypothetical protein